MKNHFFFSYAGNKREEVEHIYSKINFENIDTICEPFCGSCAMSYYIWKQLPTKRFKYVLNDLDKNLYELLSLVKSGDKKRMEEIEKEINDVIRDEDDEIIITKEEYNKFTRSKTLTGYIMANRYYNLRTGLFPPESTFKRKFKFSDYPIYDFLTSEDITISNKDGCDIIQDYDKDNVFMFLDPPYIASCNNFYSDDKLNMYDYLVKIGFKNFKSKMLICHENNWLFKILFNDYINDDDEYKKMYQNSLHRIGKNATTNRKKTTTHICIMNY